MPGGEGVDELSATFRRASALTRADVLEMREKYFCGAQSVSYANTDPLWAVRAKGVFIYDAEGKEYLDTRNNVGHVGWQHPKFVKAVSEQISNFNANSRYVNHLRVALAEKLLSKFPENLKKVFFVNSGSEANDLALRLARTHTKNRDVIVVDRAYHGHTVATLSISPYKFEHKGGRGIEDYVHKVPCPDTYRGKHDTAEEYAAYVKNVCANNRISSFFIESGLSVAGVIIPPKGYLQECYAHVRAAGGVCVADEVQVGFGRFGKHYFAFEQQDVCPDIVTLGKPFGNGFPIAAVVCSQEIAESFVNGLEYFNTFGGNPVAMAAGIAVMDIIEEEGLIENAAKVGELLKRLFKEIGGYVGDVRGSGLFIGVEFVHDTDTKEPAPDVASVLCSRLKRNHRILTSIDGFFDNVIVIKPPLCFSEENALFFAECAKKELDAITPEELAAYSHTPT